MEREGNEMFLRFAFGEDMDFYEEFLVDLSDEDFARFIEENPDFLRE